jgi:serine/threonine protein kinase
MGNQQSFEQHHDFKDLQTNYTYEKKFNDNRFGEIKLLKEKSSNNKIFQKDFSSNTPKEFEDYIQQIKDSSVLAHPNILRVFGYNSKKEDLFCADFYKLSLFFECFETDLEQEIARRRHVKDHFAETELWYILDAVSSACCYLQTNKIPHRDIRPYNIFVNANKEYKISATNIFRQNYNPLYFENFEGLESQTRFYSPEVLKYITTPVDKRTPIDEYKNDVFGLGMTLIEAGLLEKVDAYDYEKKQINRPAIEGGLSRLRQHYSPNLVNIVESCLDFNPETRLDFIRLDRELGIIRRDIKEKHRVTSSPQRNSEGRTIELAQRTPGEKEVRAGPGYPGYVADDLDARVREAVRRSEAVIQRSSPTKYSNKNLDPYIQAYLRDDLNNPQQNVLIAISPYLTSESKYTTTLTIEQPNYGRESQPINFSQVRPEEYTDSVKKSAFDATAQPQAESNYAQPGGYTAQPTDAYGTGAYRPATVSFGNVEHNYAADSLRKSGTNQHQSTTQYGTSSYGQTGAHQTSTTAQFGGEGAGLRQSGTAAGTYGTSSYGTAGQYGTTGQYGTSYGTTSQTNTATAQFGHADTLKQSGGATAGTYGTSNYGTAGQYGTSSQYGTTSYQPATNYYTSDVTGGAGAGTSDLLKKSGTGQNYGTTSYTTTTYTTTNYGGPAGTTTYGTTTYGATGAEGNKDYAAEADELSRRINERLNQSRTGQQQIY